MIGSLTLVAAAALAGDPFETQWSQVGPVSRQSETLQRSRDRAVVLIQGMRPHPFSSGNVAVAEWDDWQLPGSRLVNALSRDADVFAFAFAQTVSVERIAQSGRLADNVRQLKRLNYSEIVLVGYSAGGLVARYFVEDQPGAGVTKVVQVCAPNGGSGWAHRPFLVRWPQREFLNSMTKHSRRRRLEERADKLIPASVEFVCLVGDLDVDLQVKASFKLRTGRSLSLTVIASGQGDGVVTSDRQWPADFQEQGIPAVRVSIDHLRIVSSHAGVRTIARLVREPQPRWTAGQVAEARKKILDQ